MADNESSNGDKGIHKIIPAKGDTPAKKRQKYMIIATFVLVFLTLMLVMRNRSSSATAAANTSGSDSGVANDGSAFTPSASSGGSGDYGAQLAGEIGSIPNQVSTMLNMQNAQRLAQAQARLASARKRLSGQRKTINRQRTTIRRDNRKIAASKHQGGHSTHVTHTGKKNPHRPVRTHA